MSLSRYLRPLFHILACVGMSVTTTANTPSSDVPETVVVTYLVKPNAAAALSKVIARHWSVARRMHLVRASPHIVLQGEEQGKPYILEIFTWRDGSIPDNAPDEITELWREMGGLVESRAGRAGVDFSRVQLLGHQ